MRNGLAILAPSTINSTRQNVSCQGLTPFFIVLISIAVISVSVVSHAVTVPNIFSSGTKAKASEVNANFAALEETLNALEAQVATQQTEIATLQADLTTIDNRLTTTEGDIVSLDGRLTTVENNDALLLEPCLTITSDTINGLVGPHVIFEGVNLHIRNGSGATSTINALGNLVVGYNEEPFDGLNPGDRDGSHNFIVGREHRYLSYGGFVAGFRNTVSGFGSSISGGAGNDVIGNYSSVSGGLNNTASGNYYSSVSGGYSNTASSGYSSVSGGYDNTASGMYSSISGGATNTASGNYSSVSGGYTRSVTDTFDWRAGGLWQDD